MHEVLKGIRVVEVAQWWFVPAAGAVLADWGAEVIKVEHPETGDPMRGLITSGLIPGAGKVNFMVEQPNRGKRGIGIDLAKPEGLELLYRLVETADVFLTSFLPAARRRLKIDAEDIRKVIRGSSTPAATARARGDPTPSAAATTPPRSGVGVASATP